MPGNPERYYATVLADSINPTDDRVTTLQIRMPLCVWPEFLTHRTVARNARSNRAVPSRVLISEVIRNPFIPEHWGRNRSGMQSTEPLTGIRRTIAREAWLGARWGAVAAAWVMSRAGLHKQDANRVLAPWQWVDAVVTGDPTAWSAFLRLRDHPAADPKIQRIAVHIAKAIAISTPQKLGWNQWHKPYYTDKPQYVAPEEGDRIDMCMASAGACARVSYAAFDGQQSDRANEELAKKLAKETPSHGSPFEHVVRASMDGDGYRRAGRQCLRGNWETLRAIKRL
jgi:hypothetical protein